MDEFNKDPFNEEKPQQTQNQQPYQQNYNYNQQNINQQGYIPPQHGGYGYQQYTPYPQQPSQGMAVASLVLGIISIVFSYFTAIFPFLFIVPIIGIVLGALHKSKHLPVGKGLSTAGIVTSIVGIVLTLLIYVLCVVIVLFFMNEILDFLKQTSPQDYEMLYEMYGEQFPEWFSDACRFFVK
ncbi:MAG: DUF4190 domain-containing protein [Oscillospiraceae bacterium]|nr:DUF4190 domain-containing protein [Oscillospiraceae bacterium]